MGNLGLIEFLLIMGVLGAIGFGAVKVFQLLRRPGVQQPHLPLQDPELRQEVDELRARLGELEERVDFAERLLAQVRSQELPPHV